MLKHSHDHVVWLIGKLNYDYLMILASTDQKLRSDAIQCAETSLPFTSTLQGVRAAECEWKTLFRFPVYIAFDLLRYHYRAAVYL